MRLVLVWLFFFFVWAITLAVLVLRPDELQMHELLYPIGWIIVVCFLCAILTASEPKNDTLLRKFRDLKLSPVITHKGGPKDAHGVAVAMWRRIHSESGSETVSYLPSLVLFVAFILIRPAHSIGLGVRMLSSDAGLSFLLVAHKVCWAALIAAVGHLLVLAYADMKRAWRVFDHLTCLVYLDGAWLKGIPHLNCLHSKNAIAWFRLNEHTTMFVQASNQSWMPCLFVILLVMFLQMCSFLVVFFITSGDTIKNLVFYLHSNLFTLFGFFCVTLILLLQARTLGFVEKQIRVFEQLKLQAAQHLFDAAMNGEFKLNTTEARLNHLLLDQLLQMVLRRGTPFELFGVKVNGNIIRILVTILAAAIASACVKEIISMQETNVV